ncbi:RIP metalloprotease RseP [Limnochorda pilosa]|uniref:Zinc metalloprotease n=1 Tax=Limnochorda pilosa TaxID=1555112 RepID=A0A0K2SK89_LIMPI|nr:RIP metalloprotease RseP [Limnochorda pilosa]BAS27531.1 peptidase [Limnochorda pilosa]
MNSLVAFVLVFGTIVFFHELGHYGTAKLLGIGVHEFSVGFGPALVSRRWRGTRYSVRIVPLGGFCKLAGMEPVEDEQMGLQPQDPRHFGGRPLWQRTLVILAGPLMNFVQAVVFLALISTATIPVEVVGLEQGGPAARAGVQPGDVIVAIDGRAVAETGDVNRWVTQSQGRPIEVRLLRDGEPVELSIRPEAQRDGITRIGVQIVGGSAGVPWWRALPEGAARTWEMTRALVVGIWSMITHRAPVDVAGPVGIFQVVSQSAERGWLSLLTLAALLNVNLGLLNLLPIPALDGGWLLFLGLEGVRGKPLAPEQQGWVQVIGFAFLMALMLFATYQDILRLFHPFAE